MTIWNQCLIFRIFICNYVLKPKLITLWKLFSQGSQEPMWNSLLQLRRLSSLRYESADFLLRLFIWGDMCSLTAYKGRAGHHTFSVGSRAHFVIVALLRYCKPGLCDVRRIGITWRPHSNRWSSVELERDRICSLASHCSHCWSSLLHLPTDLTQPKNCHPSSPPSIHVPGLKVLSSSHDML